MSFWTEGYRDNSSAPYWRCSLSGCTTGRYPECERCGAELYGDADFVECGIIDAFRNWLYWRVIQRPKCPVCSKRTGFGPNAPIVHDACVDQWVPF